MSLCHSICHFCQPHKNIDYSNLFMFRASQKILTIYGAAMRMLYNATDNWNMAWRFHIEQFFFGDCRKIGRLTVSQMQPCLYFVRHGFQKLCITLKIKTLALTRTPTKRKRADAIQAGCLYSFELV